MLISEIKNDLPTIKPVKEIMSIYIDGINPNIPNRNGFIYALIGSPGSGKSSLLLSLFRSKNYYKNKFNHIYLITPESSFLSVKDHPFENHNKVYHELTSEVLENIYNELVEIKKDCIDNNYEIEHACIIVDDYASDLKDKELIKSLKQLLIKSRHIGCSFIFTLQTYNLFPLVLRKLLTNVSLFKPKNKIELDSVRKELINLSEQDTQDLMNYVFSEEYSHLDVDTNTNILRKNFNKLIIK
jgi:ABC-type dipeptide/oligopeptide/nickel transport system ATPase component